MSLAFLETFSSSEAFLFFRRWLRHPLQVGSVIPSSRYLAQRMCRHVALQPGDFVVELGGGTGGLTRVLLERLPPNQLVVVEKDPVLCDYLKTRFPTLRIIQGDARKLGQILPPDVLGKVSHVISGIPFRSLPEAVSVAIVQESFSVMKSGGQFLQFTYSLTSPLPDPESILQPQRLDRVVRNLPPATIWGYTKPLAALTSPLYGGE